MILVDTSVLIDYLKENTSLEAEKYETILKLNIPFGITSHVYQEVLQGTTSRKDFNLLKKYLDTFVFYFPKDSIETYAEAANIYFKCRKAGITVRSTIDCLIVQICLENELQLLHKDRDFINIQKVIHELKFF